MNYVQAGSPFYFQYPAYDPALNDLNVAGNVYNVTTGTAVFDSQVEMSLAQDGVYEGQFTPEAGQAYLVNALVYTDDTFETPDLSYSPWSDNYVSVGPDLTRIFFNYATYDQDEDLAIAAYISGEVDLVPMVHVANGVYFGYFDGEVGGNYLVSKYVFTDDTYEDLETERAPGVDAITLLDVSLSVTNILTQATLVGQGEAEEFTNLTVSQGDTVVFDLLAVLGNNDIPFDLTGATFTSYIRGPIGTVVEFANSQHTAKNQTTNRGGFTLSLSAEDTAALAVGVYREIITRVAQGDSVVFFHGFGILDVLPNVPVQ